MPHRRNSSPASAICLLEWRPSRALRRLLALLSVLAAVGLWMSALPASLAGPGSGLLGLAGVRRWRRLGRCAPRRLQLPQGPGVARVDGLPVADLRVEWRGSLARVSWRRGPGRRPRQALLFWPDTLSPRQRRELRLATCSRAVSPRPPAMAP